METSQKSMVLGGVWMGNLAIALRQDNEVCTVHNKRHWKFGMMIFDGTEHLETWCYEVKWDIH